MPQASDGDNIPDDNPRCIELLQKITGFSQGFFYTEISEQKPTWGSGFNTNLWDAYKRVMDSNPHKNMWMAKVHDRADIWPVFREFFKKRAPSMAWDSTPSPNP